MQMYFSPVAWRQVLNSNAWPSQPPECKRLLFQSCPFALPFLGGAVAPEPLQRQLAARLCELEPEGGNLAGLPGGKAEGRGPRTGSRSSHQTRGSPHTGAGAGECIREWVKHWMKELHFNWLEVGKVVYSKRNLIWWCPSDYCWLQHCKQILVYCLQLWLYSLTGFSMS